MIGNWPTNMPFQTWAVPLARRRAGAVQRRHSRAGGDVWRSLAGDGAYGAATGKRRAGPALRYLAQRRFHLCDGLPGWRPSGHLPAGSNGVTDGVDRWRGAAWANPDNPRYVKYHDDPRPWRPAAV